jgi:hypothetical protein
MSRSFQVFDVPRRDPSPARRSTRVSPTCRALHGRTTQHYFSGMLQTRATMQYLTRIPGGGSHAKRRAAARTVLANMLILI